MQKAARGASELKPTTLHEIIQALEIRIRNLDPPPELESPPRKEQS